MLERLKQVNARGAPEESVALRVAVLVAVMAAALAVLAHGVGGPDLRLGVAAGIPGAFWFSHRARYREGFWLKVALAVAVVVAFASFLDALRGVEAGSLANVQIPLAELFLWVQLIHAFDVPARRDLLFSLLSSVVLVAVAGVVSVSMDLLPYLLVWSVAAPASLVLAHRSQLAELPVLGSGPGGPAPAPAGRGQPGPVARPLLPPVASTVAVVTLLGTGAFFLLPPAGGARALTFPRQLGRSVPVPNLGGLANPSLGDADPARRGGPDRGRGRAAFGYFGFADSLDTAIRGRPDETLVMRVRSTRPDFWRGQTFDVWDGRRWTMSDDRPRSLTGGPPIDVPPVPGEERLPSGPELVQTYYLERPGPNLVFGANRVTSLYFPYARVFQLSDGTLRAGVAPADDAVYTVVSTRPAATAAVLRAADVAPAGVPAAVARRYTRLPAVPERVRRLAEDVTASAPTVYDKVKALEAWMAANTRYSLDIPRLPPGADAVEQFLFVDRTGFCEQIGTSLVVMLRSLGIPTRLVAGFTPGQRNPFTGLYEVRASDAHAWAEVWFPGIGWQAFDPTASVPLAGEEGPARAASGLASYLAAKLPRPPAWAVTSVVAVGLALAVAVALVRLVAWWRRGRGLERSWPDACLARLEAVGAAHGRQRRPSETVREYAAALRRTAVADPRLEEVAAVVTRQAFSGADVDEAERARVELVLDEVSRSRR